MLTMHPTLLVGPSDWDPARFPREEFQSRIAALWRAHDAAGGAIVYGDARQHSELAYLTHFTPKLEPAIALIPRGGEPQFLVGGGINMLPAAKPLTWIERLVPLRDAGKVAAAWIEGLSGDILLIGADGMPEPLHRAVGNAVGRASACHDATSTLHRLMSRKGERELAAIRDACATLDAAVAALAEAKASGAGVTDAILAAEHAAHRGGAQDVRTLFSLDGGRTLRSFDMPVARPVDPLQAYVAVKQFGYWAEGFLYLSATKSRVLEQVYQALNGAIAAMVAGAPVASIAGVVASMLRPLAAHPVTAHCCGSAIGLSLDEPPRLTSGSGAMVENGGVYSLRIGVSDRGQAAIVSAMVAVRDGGNDILWRARPNA
jgi:Xaa-Pro aminopeptidase